MASDDDRAERTNEGAPATPRRGIDQRDETFPGPSPSGINEVVPLKYALKIVGMPDCPPERCVAADGIAFRFVFNPVHDPRSFRAPGDWDAPKNAHLCEGWALSCFPSESKARKFFANLLKRNPEARERYGTHVATGRLLPAHGRVGHKNRRTGHFAIHENEGVDLAPAFTIVGIL